MRLSEGSRGRLGVRRPPLPGRALGALALAAASAGGAARLLAPRTPATRPDRVDPRDYFSDAEIRAARRYARPQMLLAASRGALEIGVLWLLVFAREEPARRRPPQRSTAADALATGAYAAGLNVALAALKLGPNALSRRRSLAVGLSTQSWRAWAEDLVKATTIEALLSGTLLAGSSALARRRPRSWWLGAAAGGVLTGALAGVLAPVLMDPIFNRFDPLPEGEARSDVLALADAAGVSVGEVYSVDASRRTTAVNAYVNGLGPTKRVVLFDTLLAGYSRDEIRFVVAHELGHVRHRDVVRQIAFLTLSAPAAALAAQQLTEAWAGTLAGPRAVPALSLALSLVAVPLALNGAALSRAVERRTDDFGLALSDAPAALISFFRRIAVQNHADVSAPGRVRRLLASHPPITERIGAALAYERLTTTGGAGPKDQP